MSMMKQWWNLATVTVLSLVLGVVVAMPTVDALGSQENPQTNAMGMEGTVPGDPPSQAATITVPTRGQTFTKVPITVAGLCKSDLLVKVFSNNVFIGSARCEGGSYDIRADLFSGRNDLVARVYDALDQAGPDSNVVSVTFNDAQFAEFGSHVTLSSKYARLGADPGKTLTWPIVMSGGLGPYAVSVDWGDGKGTDLKSVAFAGNINLTHIYDESGVYNVIVKATDANSTSAYLQLVGVATGKISGVVTTGNSDKNITVTKTSVIWWPLLAVIPLLIVAFWLGRRHELFTIRRNIEESRNQIL